MTHAHACAYAIPYHAANPLTVEERLGGAPTALALQLCVDGHILLYREPGVAECISLKRTLRFRKYYIKCVNNKVSEDESEATTMMGVLWETSNRVIDYAD